MSLHASRITHHVLALCSLCLLLFSATAETIRYVNTASTAGGNGTSNATAGANRAFVSLADALDTFTGTMTDQVTIYCEGTAADTTSVVGKLNQVTTAANYIRILTTPGNRHNGTWSTDKYRLELVNEKGIYCNVACHVRIEGLQIKITVNNGSRYEGIKTSNINQTASDVDMRCSDTIIRGVVTSGTVDGFVSSPVAGSGQSRAWNLLVYDCTNGIESLWDEQKFYNCTAYGNTYGFLGDGVITVINCLAAANSGFDFTGSFSGSCKNNAASDATAPGSNSRNSQTFTFANAGADNFQIAAADAGAKGYGFTDPGAGLFSNDLLLGTREAPWDIGAFRYVGATNAVVTVARYEAGVLIIGETP